MRPSAATCGKLPRSLLIAVVLLGSGFGCSCNDQSQKPAKTIPFDCLPLQTASLELLVEPAIVKLRSADAVTAALNVVPLAENGQSVEPTGAERYYLDPEGDGVFETSVTSRASAIPVTMAGRFPIQVTAVRCDGDVVVGRTQFIAIRSKPPILDITFSPELDVVYTGTAVQASLMAVDPDGAGPIDVWWNWGDGAAEAEDQLDDVRFRDTGPARIEHTFNTRGIYEFRAAATDQAGDVTSTSVTYVVVSRIAPWFRLDLGQKFLGASYDQGDATSPVLPPGVAVAAGDSGLLLYEKSGPGLRFRGRAEVDTKFRTPAVAVAVDPVHRMAYVPADNRGAYFMDVSDRTRPKSLSVARASLEPGYSDGIMNVDAAWVCGDTPEWVWIRNRGSALHMFELTSVTLLERDRNNPPLHSDSPPSNGPYRAVTTLSDHNARDVKCLEQRWIGVANPGNFVIYDLEPLLTAGDPPRKFVVAPPTAAPEIGVKTTGIEGVTDPTDPTILRWYVALGEHGVAEYTQSISPTVSAPQLAHHFAIYQRGSLLLGDIYDYIYDLAVTGDALFLADYAYGVQDALIALDRAMWASQVTVFTEYGYETGKCLSDARPEIVQKCFANYAIQKFLAADDGHLWTQGFASNTVSLSQVSQETGTITATGQIPQPLADFWVGPDWILVFGGRELLQFDRADVEAGVTTGTQPAPVSSAAIPFTIKKVAAIPGQSEVVVYTGAEFALANIDGFGELNVVTKATVQGIREIVYSPAKRLAAVIRSADGRAVSYRFDGLDWIELKPSVFARYRFGYECNGEVEVWRDNTDGSYALERIQSNGTFKIHRSIEVRGLHAAACDGDYVYVVDEGSTMGRLRIRVFAANTDVSTPVFETQYAYLHDGTVSGFTAEARDGLLLIQIKSTPDSLYFIDFSSPTIPLFVGAEIGTDSASMAAPRIIEAGADPIYAGMVQSGTIHRYIEAKQVQ